MALLGEFVNIKTGKLDANAAVEGGQYPFFTCSRNNLKIDNYAFDANAILLAGNGDLNVKHYKGKFNAYQRTYVITVEKVGSLDARYLFHWMSKYVGRLRELSIGGVIKYIKLGMLTDADIPLPPLAEQKRIAAILDKADAIRRKRQQAIDLTDQLLRSVFLDMFGDPVTNPKGWKVFKLRDIAHIQIGPFGTQLHKEDYIEDGVPIVNPTHIVSGKVVPSRKSTISKEKHHELSEYHLSVDDVVMGRRGEMGRCALIAEREAGWLCGTGSLYVRPSKRGIFPEYLCALLSGDVIRAYLESEALGATMPNLNKGIVGNIDIPVPTDTVLNRYFEIRTQYKYLVKKSKQFHEIQLFDSLCQHAFLGELSQQSGAA